MSGLIETYVSSQVEAIKSNVKVTVNDLIEGQLQSQMATYCDALTERLTAAEDDLDTALEKLGAAEAQIQSLTERLELALDRAEQTEAKLLQFAQRFEAIDRTAQLCDSLYAAVNDMGATVQDLVASRATTDAVITKLGRVVDTLPRPTVTPHYPADPVPKPALAAPVPVLPPRKSRGVEPASKGKVQSNARGKKPALQRYRDGRPVGAY